MAKNKIHTNIHCEESVKQKYEENFLKQKLKNPGLKQKDIFLAFVQKFNEDPEKTLQFINLKNKSK